MPAAVAIVAAVAGSTGIATAIGGTVLAAFGVTAASTAMATLAAGVIGGAIVGAVAGGITAAITGGDILDGALKGGLIGGIAGGIGAWGEASSMAKAQGGWTSGAGSVSKASIDATNMVSGTMSPSETTAVTGENVMANGLDVTDPGFIDANNASRNMTSDFLAKGKPIRGDAGLLEAGELTAKASGELVKGASKISEEAGKGGLLGISTTDMLKLGGETIKGAAEYYGAADTAESAERLADKTYERNKPKLQSGVDLGRSYALLDEEAYAKSGASPTGAAVPVARPTVSPNKYVPKPTQGLLNKA